MATPTKNGNGAKEVTPATTNKTNSQPVNGKTTTTPSVTPKAEEKPTGTEPTPPVAPVAVEKPAVPEPPKPKTLDEQISFFLGLERLVNIRRRFEHHLAAVNELVIEDEELTKFETNNKHGIRIELYDSNGSSYAMTNPRLVKEMHAHLVDVLQGKIDECNTQILTYGAQ